MQAVKTTSDGFIATAIPFVALPMLVKNFAIIGCNPFKKVKNMYILKRRTAKLPYNASPDPNELTIKFGNSWKIMKATQQITRTVVAISLNVCLTLA